MDNRKHLNIPDNFSFIIRSGGANLKYSEFKVSYAIAIGNVKHIVLIAHNNCGMVNINNRKQEFINGLVNNAGWNIKEAEEHFIKYQPLFEINNEIDFIINESNRIKKLYPNITVVPMYYKTDDNLLYLINTQL